MKASDSQTLINLSLHNFILLFLSTTCLEVPRKDARSSVRALIYLVCLSFLLLPISVAFCACFLFIFHSFVSLSPTHFGTVNPASVSSVRVFPSSPFLDSFVPNSLIPSVLRLNVLLEPNSRTVFYDTISPSETHPPNVTAQKRENASPAMNEIFPGTTTKDRSVASQARASMRANCEFVSNESDESALQYPKHNKQRI
jgi:hypothetical protein